MATANVSERARARLIRVSSGSRRQRRQRRQRQQRRRRVASSHHLAAVIVVVVVRLQSCLQFPLPISSRPHKAACVCARAWWRRRSRLAVAHLSSSKPTKGERAPPLRRTKGRATLLPPCATPIINALSTTPTTKNDKNDDQHDARRPRRRVLNAKFEAIVCRPLGSRFQRRDCLYYRRLQ